MGRHTPLARSTLDGKIGGKKYRGAKRRGYCTKTILDALSINKISELNQVSERATILEQGCKVNPSDGTIVIQNPDPNDNFFV